MAELFFKRETCRLCASNDLEIVVKLEPMPIATPNFKVTETIKNTGIFNDAIPLELCLCKHCGHLQILHVGNRKLQYSNYVYTTSVSLGLQAHFKDFAKKIDSKTAFPNGSTVVEFGSNDGTLLQFFKDRGKHVVGIDPAVDIAQSATNSGIPTINGFFSEQAAKDILRDHGRAKILIANNVIANIDNMEDIAKGIKILLDEDGIFVAETQYGVDVIEHMLLDTIYHEHLSYFNVKPLKMFFERHDMQLIEVELINTKGGSIRITAQHKGGPRYASPIVEELILKEDTDGFYDVAIYNQFVKKISAIRGELSHIVQKQRSDGQSVAGYGVSVGTTTMLPQFGLTSEIDFFVDDDPNKNPSLNGPGYNIPVFTPDEIYSRRPGVIIIFAWRYAPNIISHHERYLKGGGIFLIPLPHIQCKST